MKYIAVTLGVWKWEGIIAAGGTIGDFIAFAKSHGASEIHPENNGHSVGRAYVEIGVPWLLWVESLEDVPALAHEALHVTAGVLEARGLKYVPESEEAYTYTMEGILRAALTATDWQPVDASDAS